MPTDGTGKEKRKVMIRRHRSSTDGSSFHARFEDQESLLPPPLRRRLNELFAQIEKEFEVLYADNVALQEKLDRLEGGDEVDGGKVVPKKSGSQISQKIKTTYKTSTSRLVSTFKAATVGCDPAKEFTGHRDGVWEVSVSKLGQKVIGTASADNTARLWCVNTGLCLLQYVGHRGSVNSIRFHPTSDHIATASGDGTVHIWRGQVNVPATAEKHHSSGEDDQEFSEKEEMDFIDGPETSPTQRIPIIDLTGHSNVVIAADWTAGGSQVITASWDRTAILYDAETGAIIDTLTGHDLELTNVCVHPTQKLFVTSSKDTTFRLWDFRGQSMQLNVFQGHTQPVTSAVFASDDKIISGSDDRSVKIWDLKNMRSPIATIRTDSAVNRLSVSPQSKYIAIPQDNRHVRLYDIHGVRLGRLPRSSRMGHSRMVSCAAWSDEQWTGCNLFTCGFDRQVLGWHYNPQRKDTKEDK